MNEEGRPTLLIVIVTCAAFFLQIIGLSTPGWLYMIVNYVKVHFGLWYMVTCVRSKCVTSSTLSGTVGSIGETTFTSTMSVYRGLTVVGAIACLVAIILLIVSRRSSLPNQTGQKIASFLLLVSGVLAFSAAAKFAASIIAAINLYDTYNQHHPYAFPYSLFITGLGGALAVIMFFVLICKTSCGSGRNGAASQGGMVMNPPPYTSGNVPASQGGMVMNTPPYTMGKV